MIAFKGMNGPGFPTASRVAPRIQDHFVRYLVPDDAGAPPAPLVEDIEAVIDAGFWASLKREEGTSRRSRWRWYCRSRWSSRCFSPTRWRSIRRSSCGWRPPWNGRAFISASGGVRGNSKSGARRERFRDRRLCSKWRRQGCWW